MKRTNVFLSSLILSTMAFQANAATSIATYVQVADVATGTATLNFTGVRAASWVSETMGFLGWTHFSKWGFVNLTKGQVVTIALDATATVGFHPAVSVWQRDTNKPATDKSLYYMDDHFYAQSSSVSVKNAINNDNAASPVPVGNVIRTFIANAYDADNLGDYIYGYASDAATTKTKFGPYLPIGYNTKDIQSASAQYDKTPGKVSVTFTAPKTAVYQFVIGGLKPDVDSAASKVGATGAPVTVTVTAK